MMQARNVAGAALAAVLGITGLGSILVLGSQPGPVDAVELEGRRQVPEQRDPAMRPEDDDVRIELVDDDRDGGNTGDGDRTRGDDGTSGGANTGDGDRTRGDDGTSGGANTRAAATADVTADAPAATADATGDSSAG